MPFWTAETAHKWFTPLLDTFGKCYILYEVSVSHRYLFYFCFMRRCSDDTPHHLRFKLRYHINPVSPGSWYDALSAKEHQVWVVECHLIEEKSSY